MKISKRQLKRIIREEKANILREYGGAGMDAKNALEFAISEYVQARWTEGEQDPNALQQEMIAMVNQYIEDQDWTGVHDGSDW